MSDPLTDTRSSLLVEAMHGRREAMNGLLTRVRPTVFRWVVGKTREPDDAEDITQLVLLRVCNGLPGFREKASLSSWLYRLTANEVAGFYRKRNRSHNGVVFGIDPSRIESRNREMEGASLAPNLATRLDFQRVEGLVRNFACALPPLQQAALRLVDREGLKPCEVARELGKTQTTPAAGASVSAILRAGKPRSRGR